ncbi:MAG: hypothetical protein HRT74_05715 [Flavobacteriales bacterium]|nr:hypothetical protein [Flavobacteriales bacterium]
MDFFKYSAATFVAFSRLYRSFLQEKNYVTARMAYKLNFSLYMYGVHQIEKDITKVESLASTTDKFEEIGPLLKRIKLHLRQVKSQIIEDYKMVITLVD